MIYQNLGRLVGAFMISFVFTAMVYAVVQMALDIYGWLYLLGFVGLGMTIFLLGKYRV